MNIQVPCTEFDQICKSWVSYKPDIYSLSIRYVKLWDLPNDVFDENETRPVKTKKRKTDKNCQINKKMKMVESGTESASTTPNSSSNIFKKDETTSSTGAVTSMST